MAARSIRLFLTLCLLAAPWGKICWAQEAPTDFTVSETIFRRLDRAQKALEKKNYQGAHAALDELKNRRNLSNYERALMWQTRSYIYVSQNELGPAGEAMTEALSLNALPPDAELSMRFNLGQVLLANDQPKKSLQQFKVWASKAQRPSADSLYTVAVAHAQAKSPAGAVQFIDRALRAKKDPPENWYRLKLAAHVRLEQWGPAIRVMAGLVEKKRQDHAGWKQLSALYAQANRTSESVATLELAFRLGLLTEEKDIRLLAQNLMASGLPLKSAEVIEAGMKKKLFPRSPGNLELLGKAYVGASARSRAVAPLEAAAKAKKDGRLYAELGRIHMAEKQWAKASSALSRALSLGGLRQPGQTYVMLGMARHQQQKPGEARKAFQAALKFDNSRRTAESWLKFIAGEG
ncbi:MAG: hypothetical protein AAF627_12690 [Myxococcota bacterium]